MADTAATEKAAYRTAETSAFVSPYCDDPECHNSRTSDYSEGGGNGQPPLPLRTAFVGGGGIRWRLGRRWCRSHALINEGWAVG